jgi:hypothetical protein
MLREGLSVLVAQLPPPQNGKLVRLHDSASEGE